MRMMIAWIGFALAVGAGPADAQGARDAAGMLARADQDGDGVVTLAEARAAREGMFERLDANANGGIEPSELRGRGLRGDVNRDGVLSRAEFLDLPFPAFERFDANGDDVLDAGELAALRQAAAARGGR